MGSVTPSRARPQGPPPDPDQLEGDLALARRMVLAMAEAMAGAGSETIPAWCDPGLVAGALDTIASLATGLAGELRGEELR